jgi:hypothetical protein
MLSEWPVVKIPVSYSRREGGSVVPGVQQFAQSFVKHSGTRGKWDHSLFFTAMVSRGRRGRWNGCRRVSSGRRTHASGGKAVRWGTNRRRRLVVANFKSNERAIVLGQIMEKLAKIGGFRPPSRCVGFNSITELRQQTSVLNCQVLDPKVALSRGAASKITGNTTARTRARVQRNADGLGQSP